MPPASTPNTQIPAAEVRRRFVEFFTERGHAHHPSSPVVPLDDPTLLFTNAGMNQFKPVFLGDVPKGSPLAGLTRAANSQKCIRAGGKHNDLEDVGRDSYHHTFFEMLGNWSFGDYFKAEAIDYAWELLTGVFKLDPTRFYATYFGGDEARKLAPDTEARDLWLRHLPAERVLPGSFKDNFWEMGDTGPCGPCSELHYDRVGGRDARELVNADREDVIEIWNLVFIQFDRQASGELRTLPDKHVDTGMGFERLVSVLNGTASNYDSDLFMPLFGAISAATGAPAYAGRFGDDDKDGVDTAYRVIADHLRTLTFAITDGAVPSNEGRGYVLRRILRRAVRFGRQKLSAKGPFLADLVPAVAKLMGDAFPELKRDPGRVRAVILDEEESFGRTLDRGFRLFEDAAEAAQKSGGTVSGDDAFRLYDTYGFPLDLTELMAKERGLSVDTDGFDRAMAAQKDRSKAGAKGSSAGDGPDLALSAEEVAKLRRMNIPETDDNAKFFVGERTPETPGAVREVRATLRAIWDGKNFDENATALGTPRPVGLVFDKTCFYAEMGGQVGDCGRATVTKEAQTGGQPHGGEARVENTRAFGGFIVHEALITRGELRVGDTVSLRVDLKRRRAIEANHTATHLLNFALREALGDGVDQRGSLVAPDRLRFDFTNNGPAGAAALAQAEAIVNKQIEGDLPVHAELAPLVDARAIEGLRAVFGEQYPDPVRVVSIGAAVGDLLGDPSRETWRGYAIEFCGGTHLPSTGAATAFAITGEEAVAKGIRRVTAVTGEAAVAARSAADELTARVKSAASLSGKKLKDEMQTIAAALDEITVPAARAAEIRASLAALQETAKAEAKAAAAARAGEAAKLAERLAEDAANTLDPVFISTIDIGSDIPALQAALKVVANKAARTPVMLLSPDEDAGKVAVVAAVPKDAVAKGLKAGDWVKVAAGEMGGKGGGRPDAAQGAGTDLGKVRDAISAARRFGVEKLT